MYIPAPAPRIQQRTPFLHCAAGALVWYVAVVVGYGIAQLRTATEAHVTLVEAIIGAVAWALTTTLVWLFLRLIKARLEPWLLILVALPIYAVTWFMIHIAAFVFAVAFVMPR